MFWIFSSLALFSAATGYRYGRFPALASSFAGGLLAGLGLIVALPEAVAVHGLAWGVAGAATGFVLMALFDRWVHPLCETCAQSGVLLAMLLHALVDGALAGAGSVLALGVLVHRLPEALVTGMLLRSLQATPERAAGQMLLIQAAFGLAFWFTPPSVWLAGGMAAAGGALFYMGLHRWHAEEATSSGWQMVPAGMAGAAISLLLR